MAFIMLDIELRQSCILVGIIHQEDKPGIGWRVYIDLMYYTDLKYSIAEIALKGCNLTGLQIEATLVMTALVMTAPAMTIGTTSPQP